MCYFLLLFSSHFKLDETLCQFVIGVIQLMARTRTCRVWSDANARAEQRVWMTATTLKIKIRFIAVSSALWVCGFESTLASIDERTMDKRFQLQKGLQNCIRTSAHCIGKILICASIEYVLAAAECRTVSFCLFCWRANQNWRLVFIVVDRCPFGDSFLNLANWVVAIEMNLWQSK